MTATMTSRSISSPSIMTAENDPFGPDEDDRGPRQVVSRRSTPTTVLDLLAYREATHVAMYSMLGYNVDYVTIHGSALNTLSSRAFTGMLIPGDVLDWRDEIMICAAGRFLNGVEDGLFFPGSCVIGPSQADEERIRELLCENNGTSDDLVCLLMEARRRMSRSGTIDGIGVLAHELLQRGTLDGGTAQDIFQKASAASDRQRADQWGLATHGNRRRN